MPQEWASLSERNRTSPESATNVAQDVSPGWAFGFLSEPLSGAAQTPETTILCRA